MLLLGDNNEVDDVAEVGGSVATMQGAKTTFNENVAAWENATTVRRI